MVPNFNPKKGIHYGVFHCNDHEFLWDEFFNNGTDLRYAELEMEVEAAVTGLDIFSDGDDRQEAIDCLMQIINDNDLYNTEEAPYSLEHDDGSKLLLSWLGGAGIVYVCDSEWACGSAKCSPCVPKAGDLDNPDDAYGTKALCMSPEEMHHVAKGNDKTYVIYRIDEKGNHTGERWLANAECYRKLEDEGVDGDT
jgi:hypothetical protein